MHSAHLRVVLETVLDESIQRITSCFPGNEALHHITSRGNYKLKIVLTDREGVTKVAQYSTVRIGSESDGYRLTLRGYSGDAGRY